MKRLKIKNSITMRWIASVLSVIVAVVIIAAVTSGALIHSYFFNEIESYLPEYVSEFEQLKYSPENEYWANAVTLTENFEYMDKVKVSVFNSEGTLIASTDGFITRDDTEEMPDYNKAYDSDEGVATYNGVSSLTGERILATTVVLTNTKGVSLGAFRYVISMEPFNKAMGGYFLLIAAIAVIVIALVAGSGVFFVSSIVRPVRQVTGAARKIAMGDLSARLESKSDDEIGELCDTINYMASELGKTETLKNDFLSSVSHELRTPLTAIRGWGETVDMSIGNDDATVKRGIDVILTETDRLSKLVEELLDFSRLQSGSFRINLMTGEVIPILTEAVRMYNQLARKQGIDISYIESGAKILVTADRDRLKQVFINIIDNAVKYTSVGGRVIVSSELDERTVKIIIQDTGIGIKKEDLAHVKERFYKANKTVRGSGIGLAVADEIIKQHNGFILVDSIENVGTTVTVVLPIETNQTERIEKENNG